MTKPLAVTKAEAFRLIGMPKLVQRWLYHGCLEVVRRGAPGRETVIDYASLERAYTDYKKGKEPPLLPSEKKRTRNELTQPFVPRTAKTGHLRPEQAEEIREFGGENSVL